MIYNDHHLEGLKKSKVDGKLPRFLKLNPAKVRFFPEEETKSLTQKYQQALDEAAAKMLDYTLTERESLGAKLCSEAEKLNDEVETEALTKWMEGNHLEPMGPSVQSQSQRQSRRTAHAYRYSPFKLRLSHGHEEMPYQG